MARQAGVCSYENNANDLNSTPSVPIMKKPMEEWRPGGNLMSCAEKRFIS